MKNSAKKELKYLAIKDLKENDTLLHLGDEDVVTVHPDGHVYHRDVYVGDIDVDGIDFQRVEYDSQYDWEDVSAVCPKCNVLVGTVWEEAGTGEVYHMDLHSRMGNKSYREDSCIGANCPKCH